MCKTLAHSGASVCDLCVIERQSVQPCLATCTVKPNKESNPVIPRGFVTKKGILEQFLSYVSFLIIQKACSPRGEVSTTAGSTVSTTAGSTVLFYYSKVK